MKQKMMTVKQMTPFWAAQITDILELVGLTPHGSIFALPGRSKPPACFWRAAFVRFRRHPWRLFFAIA